MTSTPETNEAPLGHRLRGAILAIASDPDAPTPREAFALALNVGEEAARELDAQDAAAKDGTIVSVLSEAVLAVDTSLDPIVAPDPKLLRLIEAATAAETLLKAYAVGGPPRPKRQIEIDNDRHDNEVRRLKAQGRTIAKRDETIRELKAQIKRWERMAELRASQVEHLVAEASPDDRTTPAALEEIKKGAQARKDLGRIFDAAETRGLVRVLGLVQKGKDSEVREGAEDKRLRTVIGERDKRISELCSDIENLKAERDGARKSANTLARTVSDHEAEIREQRAAAAEARKLADENVKLKVSIGRYERRATLATNKADRRAEENAQLSRAMIELGQIIGEERQRARGAWEAVAEERERANHQEARKEEQIAKLGGTIFERIEADERVKAWEQIVKHPAFVPCYEDGARLLPAMIRRLDQLLAGQGDQ